MRMPNGYGTITKLSGERRRPWAVRVPTRDRKGHVRQKYLSYHEKQSEAVEALRAYNNERIDGLAPAPDKFSITLNDVYARWSARKYTKVSLSAVRGYKASWARLSVLGNRHIRDIGIDELQAIIDSDEENELSKASISKDHVLMKALFKYAMERDYIVKDYSAFIVLPQIDVKYEKGAFSEIALKQIEQLAREGFPWADTALMLCYTGFRITEFLTLTRFSYNAEARTLTGGIKTEAGRNRVVPVHPKIQPYLDRWLSRNGSAIICDDNGAPVTTAWYRSYAFAPIMARINMPQATPHWCRHTFASLLHAAGVSELDAKRLLGHADKNVTDHYTHTDIETLREAVLKLA